jgi:hypothetical protein
MDLVQGSARSPRREVCCRGRPRRIHTGSLLGFLRCCLYVLTRLTSRKLPRSWLIMLRLQSNRRRALSGAPVESGVPIVTAEHDTSGLRRQTPAHPPPVALRASWRTYGCFLRKPVWSVCWPRVKLIRRAANKLCSRQTSKGVRHFRSRAWNSMHAFKVRLIGPSPASGDPPKSSAAIWPLSALFLRAPFFFLRADVVFFLRTDAVLARSASAGCFCCLFGRAGLLFVFAMSDPQFQSVTAHQVTSRQRCAGGDLCGGGLELELQGHDQSGDVA